MLLKTPDTPKDLDECANCRGALVTIEPDEVRDKTGDMAVACIIRYHIAGQSLRQSTHHASPTDIVRTGGSSDPRARDILSGCKDVYDGTTAWQY